MITKRAPGLRNLIYKERLKALKLTTLREKRIRGDLIQQFKIINGFDKVNWYNKQTFVIENTENGQTSMKPVTRGDKYRMIKENIKDNIRLNFFSNRTTNSWNALPTNAIEANTVNSFKARIEEVYEINKTYETTKITK